MAKEKEPNKKEKRPTPLKRDEQSEKSRLRNKMFKSRVKTAIRKFQEEKGENAQASLNEVYSLMDKGVKKGVFKLNKASRTKSRLAAKVSTKTA